MAKDKFRYTRFNEVFETRDEAIKKLNKTARYYAENVAIKYKKGDSFEVILALYKSEEKGDYTINYDSGEGGSGSGIKIYDITKISPEESDKEAINRYSFGNEPQEGEMAVIHTPGGGDVVYMYHSGIWICITQNLIITGKKSNSIEISSIKDEVTDAWVLEAEVLTDNSSIVVGDEGLQVGYVDCGNLKDLK